MAEGVLTLDLEENSVKELPVIIGTEYSYLNSEANIIFKSYKHSLMMISDRGYTLSPHDKVILQMTVPEFVRHFLNIAVSRKTTFEYQLQRFFNPPDHVDIEENTDMVFSGNTESTEQIAARKGNTLGAVWLTLYNIGSAKSFSIEHYQKLINQYDKDIEYIPQIIVVSKKHPNKDVMNKIRVDAPQQVRFEFFTYSELSFDPRSNFLNSQFIKLTESEIKMLKEELLASGDTLAILPQISYQDKMARWYGTQPGDVVEVLRDDVGIDIITDSSIAWRRVTSKPLPTLKLKI